MNKQQDAARVFGTEVACADFDHDEVNTFLRENGCQDEMPKVLEMLEDHLSASAIKISIVRDPSEDDKGTLEFLVRSPLERKQFNQSLRNVFSLTGQFNIYRHMVVSRDC